MFLTGMVDKRTLEKYEKEAKDKNRESWYLSWALDTNLEGEERPPTLGGYSSGGLGSSSGTGGVWRPLFKSFVNITPAKLGRMNGEDGCTRQGRIHIMSYFGLSFTVFLLNMSVGIWES